MSVPETSQPKPIRSPLPVPFPSQLHTPAANLRQLLSYFPELVVERLAAHPALPTAPAQETFAGAILFADIAGFSVLADQLARTTPGRRGAEELTHLLNVYFGQVVELIAAYGGDVFEFAGDALVVVWRACAGEPGAQCAWQAAQCALALQQQFQNYAVTPTVRLSLHMGLAAGTLVALQIGGAMGRWKWLLSGDPVVAMCRAEQHAAPGQVVVAPNTWPTLASYCQGTPLAEGYVLLQQVQVPLAKPAPRRPSNWGALQVETLRAFLPSGVLTRLAVAEAQLGLTAPMEWLAELRRATVLFLNITDCAPPLEMATTQALLQTVQGLIYRYEGSFNKMYLSERGLTVVASFGLPPLAHEDDPVRGVQTALALVAELRLQGHPCAVGVTTGYVFCGEVGNNTRREYTIIGDVVNLAARLVHGARQVTTLGGTGLPIVCDLATYEIAQKRIVFDTLGPMRVKGKTEVLGVYRPLRERPAPATHTQLLREQSELLGRQTECATLTTALQRLARQRTSGVVVIEGEMGLGKTSLLQYVRQQASTLRLHTYALAGNALEQAAPYQAWRGVFSQLLDLEVLADPVARRKHVLNILEFDGTLTWQLLAPLLNVVLPLDLPESPVTAPLFGAARAAQTCHLLLQLLQVVTQPTPSVILVEDAHWLDTASWRLLAALGEKIADSPILLVLALRPFGETLPEDYAALLRWVAPAQHLRLEPLSTLDTLMLVQRQLGVEQLPQAVASWIVEKAEGNPFFCQELAYLLRDLGLITVQAGEGHLALTAALSTSAGEILQTLHLPDTLAGAISHRLDRLAPAHQLTLKVASVIGRSFAVQILRDIYPMQAEAANLAHHLAALERLNFIRPNTESPEASYIFKHAFIQEAAYNLMLFAQRRELHRQVAWAMERLYADRLADFYGALGLHCWRGELWEAAVNYLTLAGDGALRLQAQVEARRYYTAALECLAQLPAAFAQRRAELGVKLNGLG